MVHCRKLKNGKCSYTGGICFLKNPKNGKDYEVCPERFLVKDYSEMTRGQKAFVKARELEKKIKELEARIEVIEKKEIRATRKFVGHVVRPPPVDKEGIVEIAKGFVGDEKKGGLLNWLRHLGK